MYGTWPPGRPAPASIICATLMPLGSFTSPVSWASEMIAPAPVQAWQLAQAPSNTRFPIRLLDGPTPGAAGAGPATSGRAGLLKIQSAGATAKIVTTPTVSAAQRSPRRIVKTFPAQSAIGRPAYV